MKCDVGDSKKVK